MLKAAVRVTPGWAMEADAHLHPKALWDPDGLFDRVRGAALPIPPQAFADALAQSSWSARAYAARVRAPIHGRTRPVLLSQRARTHASLR
jgi:hypothetical protein